MSKLHDKADLSRFVRRANPVKLYNTVRLMVGDECIEASGIVLSQCSNVLAELVERSGVIYLDQFIGDIDGVQDVVELLYGGTVELGLDNVRILLKFSALYRVRELLELCLAWVKENISEENLFSLIELGLLFEGDDNRLSGICEKFIVSHLKEEFHLKCFLSSAFLDFSFVKFIIQRELLCFAIPILTVWVENNQHVVFILDQLDDKDLRAELIQLGVKVSPLVKQMGEVAREAFTAGRVKSLSIDLDAAIVLSEIQKSSTSQSPYRSPYSSPYRSRSRSPRHSPRRSPRPGRKGCSPQSSLEVTGPNYPCSSRSPRSSRSRLEVPSSGSPNERSAKKHRSQEPTIVVRVTDVEEPCKVCTCRPKNKRSPCSTPYRTPNQSPAQLSTPYISPSRALEHSPSTPYITPLSSPVKQYSAEIEKEIEKVLAASAKRLAHAHRLELTLGQKKHHKPCGAPNTCPYLQEPQSPHDSRMMSRIGGA